MGMFFAPEVLQSRQVCEVRHESFRSIGRSVRFDVPSCPYQPARKLPSGTTDRLSLERHRATTLRPLQDLNPDIPQCRCLGRSGKYFSAGCVGCELIQKPVLRPTANNANLLHASSTELFEAAQNHSIL